jgi:hypothetical protein
VADYKQWKHEVRDSRFREYKAARSTGAIDPPGTCEMCGQPHGTMHHAEDYGPTVEDYFAALHALCGRCHAMLHLRFRFPGRWAEYKEKCRLGVQPPIRHMGEIFGASRGWKDIPMVNYFEGQEWWERISCQQLAGVS